METAVTDLFQSLLAFLFGGGALLGGGVVGAATQPLIELIKRYVPGARQHTPKVVVGLHGVLWLVFALAQYLDSGQQYLNLLEAITPVLESLAGFVITLSAGTATHRLQQKLRTPASETPHARG